MTFVHNDGGRAGADLVGDVGDCVTRSIAIATQRPYREVYDALHATALGDDAYMKSLKQRYGKNARRHASPRDGVNKKIYENYLKEIGWIWTPTMHIGSGCKVHLVADELPPGRLIVRLSKHMCAVIDGVVHDTYDPSRDGKRCVYGYWEETK